MTRPAKLDGTDIDTKLLGTLVHWLMCNNLLRKLNTYSTKQASKDFDVSFQEYGNTEGHTMKSYTKNKRRVEPRSQTRSARL